MQSQAEGGWILGLDTSGRTGGVAAVRHGRVLGAVDLSGDRGHSDRLLPAMQFLLARLPLARSELRGVAVSVGPGSFTGVRVGLATARGLARGTGVPLVGVTSLEALARCRALPPEGAWLATWIDAGRSEVYAAAWESRGGEPVLRQEPGVGAPERWLEALPSAVTVVFRGDGAERWRERIELAHRPGWVETDGPWFLARAIALAGEQRLRAGDVGEPPLPLYVRPADARRPGSRRG